MSAAKSIWSGVYRNFQEAARPSKVFESDIWLDKVEARASHALASWQGEQTIPTLAVARDYALPTVIAARIRPGKRLKILDFGGGLGATYYEILAAIPDALECVDYHVVETPAVCTRAECILPARRRPSFFSDFPQLDAIDIVHVGSALPLHYIDDWRGMLARLASLRADLILFAELPADDIAETFASVQEFYGSPIPMWFWNIQDFVAEMGSLGYDLAHRARFGTTYRGVIGPPPMEGLPPTHRLASFCNLMFRFSGKV